MRFSTHESRLRYCSEVVDYTGVDEEESIAKRSLDAEWSFGAMFEFVTFRGGMLQEAGRLWRTCR